MKNTNFFLSLGLVALMGSFTFAQETTGGTTDVVTTGIIVTTAVTGADVSITGTISTTGTTVSSGQKDIKNGYAKLRGSWKLINEDFGAVKKYFVKPLTGDALSGAKALIKDKNAAIKAVNAEIKSALASSGTVDWTGYSQKLVDIYTSFKTNALPYVASGKVEAFTKYIDQKIAIVSKAVQVKKADVAIKEAKHAKEQAKKAVEKAKKAESKAKRK